MGKIAVFLVFFLFFIFSMPCSFSEVRINEIMSRPIDDESLNEWIELYNNGSVFVNVSGWTIGDIMDNDSMEGSLFNKEGAVLPPFGYGIVVDDTTRVYHNFNVSPEVIWLYVDDSAMGNGLINTGETIYLYSNSTLIDSITYPEVQEGSSISLINGSWLQAAPTPGYKNDQSIVHDSCDYELSIILSSTVFESENFSFRVRAVRLKGISTNISGNARIENSFGEIVRDYNVWENESIATRKTSSVYSPNLKPGFYTLHSAISSSCIDIAGENDIASEFITITGEKPDAESSLSIEDVLDLGNDRNAEFGQIIRVEIDAYKGDTNRKTVNVWLEDKDGSRLGKQAKVNLEQKFTKYALTLPVQMPMNCDNKTEGGRYSIVAEGLGQKDEKKIDVKSGGNAQCISILKESKADTKKEQAPSAKAERKVPVQSEPDKSSLGEKEELESLIEAIPELEISSQPAAIAGIASVAYESSSQKSRNLVVLLLLVFSVSINVILIWKR
ncbi:lamin tail domain-containing protein [Candidatus Woesearchaeota archaeon]|nr:lamin tail domain-containing protein [Candidatus Woesearchaeota archaeon]MBI2661506.1 lamin tail domain-containing protein [Candidatus Woesearchaeota archaeon]